MLARVADQEPGEVNSSQMQNIIVDASPHSSHYNTICSIFVHIMPKNVEY